MLNFDPILWSVIIDRLGVSIYYISLKYSQPSLYHNRYSDIIRVTGNLIGAKPSLKGWQYLEIMRAYKL